MKFAPWSQRLATLGLGLALGLLAACGGGGIGGTGMNGEKGRLRVLLTDAPACGYDAVNVTVEKVRVHQSATAAESDAGWADLVLPAPRRVDLLTLTNGVLEDLGETALPAGRYQQLRLVLASNDANSPLANSVVPTGGTETPLDTPSAQQSGLKISVDLDVPADKVLDVVLDFDACKSVVKRGNSGRYNLKPVLTATPRLSDAGLRVEGHVDPAIAAGALVSVQQSGLPVKATQPAADGRFVLYPVPEGSYALVVTAPGRATLVLTGVPVTATGVTQLSNAAQPIAPPALAGLPVIVAGSVTPATATVRAVQVLSGGTTVEVAWVAVDANNGSFDVALPLDAPVKAAFVANQPLPTFVADAAAAGLYRLEARNGGASATREIDLTAPLGPVDFVLP